MIEAFLAACAEGREPPVTWRDGYEALRVALACYDSALTGQPVRLDHVSGPAAPGGRVDDVGGYFTAPCVRPRISWREKMT
jgi:hypothetical protein